MKNRLAVALVACLATVSILGVSHSAFAKDPVPNAANSAPSSPRRTPTVWSITNTQHPLYCEDVACESPENDFWNIGNHQYTSMRIVSSGGFWLRCKPTTEEQCCKKQVGNGIVCAWQYFYKSIGCPATQELKGIEFFTKVDVYHPTNYNAGKHACIITPVPGGDK